MKKIIIILMVLLAGCLAFNMDSTVQPDKDKAAIKATALNYIEGWFEGSVERMDKALHESMGKRIITKNRNTGEDRLSHMGKEKLIEYTRRGSGKKHPGDKLNISVKILDIYDNIATVRASCFQFIDYLHIGKINGEWKIINVLWQWNNKRSKK